jgi:hypothetical protein
VTQRTLIRTAILKALRRCDGVPMPEEALLGAVQSLVRPEPGATDVRAEIKEMEQVEGFISSHSDSITGKSFTLTARGEHKAKQL